MTGGLSAISRKRTARCFVTSTGFVFKDEAAAKAYAATLRSAKYVACWTKAKAESAAKVQRAASGSTWRSGPVEAGRSPLEATLRFTYQALVNGKLVDANGTEDIFVYRHERTVIILAYEAVASKAEPSDIVTAMDRHLQTAASRLLERVRT